MNHLVSTVRTQLVNRLRYNRIVRELQSLPLDVALDLDMYAGDAERIATRAVYGH